MSSIGIDFGTTNSSVARVTSAGSVELLRFQHGGFSSRSLLFLEKDGSALRSSSGPEAIARYLQAHENSHPGRLIQSLKSYLPSRSLRGTEVFGRSYLLEDLISRMLTDLRLQAEAAWGEPVRMATVGRPVRFVGADTPEDDAYAVERLRAAFQQAGFEQITLELEPLAAAWTYGSSLQKPETILIGDFGGGTSDFSLLRMQPGKDHSVLGNAGLPFAGDAFDARLVRHLVAPALGSRSFQRGGKLIPAVPAWIYSNLERWHYLSFLRTRNVLEILSSAERRAECPEEIAALRALVDEDLGYQLHQAVQQTKTALSHSEETVFDFSGPEAGTLELNARVTRPEFEQWIEPELQAIAQEVEGLLQGTGVAAKEVDRVFLTGGTSLVPSVRAIFEQRFPDRLVGGDEFTSVAQGLALKSLAREASLA